MSFYKAKFDKADTEFSRYIRLRDRHCVKCGRPGTGIDRIDGLQCSHFWGRWREGTRFDEYNADALCPTCHDRWEGEKQGDYAAFKKHQLGEQQYKLLEARAYSYHKKDRKMALIIVKKLIESLKKIKDK